MGAGRRLLPVTNLRNLLRSSENKILNRSVSQSQPLMSVHSPDLISITEVYCTLSAQQIHLNSELTIGEVRQCFP